MTTNGELGGDLCCNTHTRHDVAFNLIIALFSFIAICVALLAIDCRVRGIVD